MIIKGIKYGILLTLFLTVLQPVSLTGQSLTKTGGIGFRIDENPPVSRIHSYDSLFSIFGKKFSFAVTSYVLPLVPAYVDTLRALSLRGVELTDNTPTHATQFFNVINFQDTNIFSMKPGVDHILGEKICLKYASMDTSVSHGEGYIDLHGNRVISYNPGEFHDLLSPSGYFAVYLSSPVKRICLFYDVKSVNVADPDTLYVKSFWDETISFPDHLHFRYHKLYNYNVVMQDSAVRILARRSLDIFDSINLVRPYTWIHPEGQYPWISPAQLKTIMGQKLNYQQASSLINPSFFCYKEYNPNERKQFGILNESDGIEGFDLSTYKNMISDAVAKHFVLFDASKLANADNLWPAYLSGMSNLLAWCNSKNIPVRTYSQWKSLIYDSLTNKTVNTFPGLDVDKNANQWPDGFDIDTASIKGIYDTTEGVSVSGYKSFKMTGGGTICSVTKLGGLEKRTNYFSFYLKGSDTASVSVVSVKVVFPETGAIVNFNSNTGKNTYLLNEFVLNIPDSVSIANFTFTRDTSYHDTLHLSGIVMRSTGFLSESVYPLQVKTANLLFSSVNLNKLIIDTLIPLNQYSWTFKGNHLLWFQVVSDSMMKINRPHSFWVGSDSVWAIAHRPGGFVDSCFFRFRSDSIPKACAGLSVNISIMDTLTSSDYIRWSSSPHDSAFTDTTIFNPTVSPKVSTWYKVKVYNLLGNISKDSVKIIRYPHPESNLFKDSIICKGSSIVLTASGGTHYLWYPTGDTTASITVKPDTLTRYRVHIENQWNCSADDSTLIHVAQVPIVSLSGLRPQYCASDDSCYLLTGTPWYGHFGGSSGVQGSQFCPRLAKLGKDTVWYQATSTAGCFNADTLYVTVNPLPSIPVQPDTNLIADKSIMLDAGQGADNYLWSNGATTQTTVVDSTHHGLGLLKVWVYVTKTSCVAMDTALINFIKYPIGINEQFPGGLFTVYPNPFNEGIYITVKGKTSEGDNARLLSLRGELISSVSLGDNTIMLPASNAPAGIYVLVLKYKGKEYYLKVVRL